MALSACLALAVLLLILSYSWYANIMFEFTFFFILFVIALFISGYVIYFLIEFFGPTEESINDLDKVLKENQALLEKYKNH